MLLKLSNAHLAYGHVPLLDGVDLQLDAGERVALIGRNGSGKSSLLAALAGQGALDDGTRWAQPGLRLAHVAQEPPLTADMSVFETVVAGMGRVSELLTAYHAISRQLADGHADAALIERMAAIQHELESLGGWSFEAQAEQVIERFGLEADARVDTLSGGRKKRLALARGLALSPDMLLLDEPTNHLDIAAIEWLETFLLARQSALLFITHDRRFLERLATRIVELDRGRLGSFPGSYAEYQRRKEAQLHEESQAVARADKLLKQEEAWIRKGVEARRTRAVFRVQRLDRLRAERNARQKRMGGVQLRVDAGEAGGQLVAELENVSKAFDGKPVVAGFSARILRGDKIGVIGPNGAGKTTLLRLILGEIAPDAGRVRRGARQEIAYFDQFRAQLDSEAALIDIISPGSDSVEIAGKKKHVISYLEDFLFPPERARAKVKSLSGGERNRLLLARLFARPANVLVLDEPTNDLDIETLELLEQLLQDYPGTVFLVSHDRVFLDNVVTQTIASAGDGIWREYVGGYADWQAQEAQRAERQRAALSAAREVAAPKGVAAVGARPASKLTWKEARELEAIPARIEALEAEQSGLVRQFEDPDWHQREGGTGAQQCAARLSEIEAELQALLVRWEALEAR